MKNSVFRIALAGCFAVAVSMVAASKAGPPAASVYYVALNGNDSFSGTLSEPNPAGTDGPFRTLPRAQQAVETAKKSVVGPITVEIRGGTYYLAAPLNFTWQDSGSASQDITWEGFPGDSEPVISGGQPLTGWKKSAGGLWKVEIPASFQNFEALYVNGQRRFRPRTSSTYLFLNPVVLSSSEPNCTEAYGSGYRCSDRFSFAPGSLAATFHEINDVEIVSFEDWTVSRMRLQSVDASQSIAYLTGVVSTGAYFGFLAGHRYLVENVASSLKQPGQWYLDRGTTPWTLSYLAMSATENPNRSAVIVPQQSQLLVAHELQYVTFKDLTFSHDNYTVPAQGHPGNSGETATPAALSFNQCSNVTLSGMTIAHTQGWGVEFLGTNLPDEGNTITGSSLYDLGTGGVRLGQLPGPNGTDAGVAQYNTVTNTMIYGGGRFLPGGEGTGIWIGSSHHNVISHNDVHDFYNGAIELGQSPSGGTTFTHDNVIEYNLLYTLGQGVTSDMGCVHAASSDNIGNQILNNVCHDVTNDQSAVGYGGNGIYLDSSSQNVVVENNLVYRVSDTALFVNTGGLGHVIDNNIFAYGRQGMMRRGPNTPGSYFTGTHNIFLYDMAPIQRLPGDWDCVGNCTSAFDLDNNVYWNIPGASAVFVTTAGGNMNRASGTYSLAEWQSEFAEDVHSMNANPMFENPKYPSDNYALMPNSPASSTGFQPFSTSTVGPTGPTMVLGRVGASIPAAFPLQLLDPATGF